ncbi:hypothetical protein SAMD00024442_78_7, partial [Candidatus Symbiothrix dinenymphae]
VICGTWGRRWLRHSRRLKSTVNKVLSLRDTERRIVLSLRDKTSRTVLSIMGLRSGQVKIAPEKKDLANSQ